MPEISDPAKIATAQTPPTIKPEKALRLPRLRLRIVRLIDTYNRRSSQAPQGSGWRDRSPAGHDRGPARCASFLRPRNDALQAGRQRADSRSRPLKINAPEEKAKGANSASRGQYRPKITASACPCTFRPPRRGSRKSGCRTPEGERSCFAVRLLTCRADTGRGT